MRIDVTTVEGCQFTQHLDIVHFAGFAMQCYGCDLAQF
jgi:hypothetical protein